MGPESYYQPAESHSWYHFSTGNILGDVALWGVGESAASAYGTGTSMLFNRKAVGTGNIARASRWMGNAMGPQNMLDKLGAQRGISFNAYTNGKTGAFQPFKLMGDAQNGAGIFKGVDARTGYGRMSRVMGGRAAASVSSRALLTLGVRSAFTALNFGLGLSIGRGVGSIIANYERHPDKDIVLETGGHFADTRSSFTQRQRAIETIHNSQLTTRAALGGEAAILHR